MSEPDRLPKTVLRLGDPTPVAGDPAATVVRQPDAPAKTEPAATVLRVPNAVSPAKGEPAATVVRAPDDAGPMPSAPAVGLAPRAFGDYELLGEIARGGMGVVYKARHTLLNRTVALKMILAGQLADESAVARFYNEAESAARLKHPHIVGIHDVGMCQGQHFFSMEFVEGPSLADLIRRRELSIEAGAALVRSIALAIHYAHGQGVLHRDLKPGNVLIDAEGQPRVTDFGLAKRVEGGDLTATGVILGSPNYMSPEQAMARHDLVGPASDVYALGAILFEVLTGKPPFSSAHMATTLFDVIHTEPTPPRSLAPQIPRDLETICLKCLAKSPQERYTTAAELAVDLDLFLRGEPITARPLSLWERVARWARRNPFLATLYGTAIVFYAFHMTTFTLLRNLTWTFHWQVTGLLAMWVTVGTLLHPALQRPRHRLWAGYGIVLATLVAGTLGLSLDRGPSSAPIFILLTAIPVAPLLLPSGRLVIFTTVAAMACYTGMAAYAWQWAPANAVTGEQFVAFLGGQLSLGLTTYLWVRGVRVVDAELSGSQATPIDSARREGQVRAHAKTVVQSPASR